MSGGIPKAPATRALALLAFLLCVATSCASVSFERSTESSGTFTSSAWAFTLFSYDIPEEALSIARENASDANRPNMVVEETSVRPYLGGFDWLLDIIGVRHAVIKGTWGFKKG